MELLAVLVVSGLFGYGLFTVVRSFTVPAPRLVEELDRLQAGQIPGPGGWLDTVDRYGALARTVPTTDLAVLEWSPVRWQRRRLAFGVMAGGAGVITVLLLRTQARFSLVAGLILVPLLFVALGVLWAVESDRSSRAEDRRKEIRSALAQLLELTSIMLAGGAGPETALEEAAAQGHGRGFRLFSGELARAKDDPALSPFSALRNLGVRLGIQELEEFGNVMILSSENAATVRQALEDKAALIIMRDHEQRKADALSRNVLMSLPVVGMAGGFIVWLVYAAIAGLASF